jgi:hypothetical protein
VPCCDTSGGARVPSAAQNTLDAHRGPANQGPPVRSLREGIQQPRQIIPTHVLAHGRAAVCLQRVLQGVLLKVQTDASPPDPHHRTKTPVPVLRAQFSSQGPPQKSLKGKITVKIDGLG